MALGNTLADKNLGIMRDDAPTALSTVYVSLHIGVAGATGANEATGNGYARVTVAAADIGAPQGSAGARKCLVNTDVEFPEATGNYSGDVDEVGFWDAASGGNFLTGGALASSKTVTAGDTPRFPSGTLEIRAY